ncbi:MAG: TIGR03013 family PEP-CTERM/XrtA system glycosyltransferase [Acidobacteriia bacterium]|nr:TIGR03013 family PEP-CTERM/XrtA system glycosyltransferase [Terriglobia bacterium]
MLRLFNVYYPVRMLVLQGGEALIICCSFLLAVLIRLGEDTLLVLQYENGVYKILAIAALAMVCLHYFDLYDPQRLPSSSETYFRLLVVLGALSFVLAATGYFLPSFLIGQGVFVTGLTILTLALLGWRSAYTWVIRQPYLRERVYVLGAGERATRLVETLRARKELGMDVVGGPGAVGNGSLSRETLASTLTALQKNRGVDRVIVAMADRRGTMPVRELLDLRLSGIKVEEATALLEKVSGKIEVDELSPSWLIFSEGFRLNPSFLMARRFISTVVSLAGLLLVLPLLPLMALAVKLTSPGPVLYRQKRVGRYGVLFDCYKFRTMRADAEADAGPTWAADDDPRITPVGRFLRRTRLDEIPQLWNVLRGDMGFVGPRPERPEFVEWLSREIPYYHLRHIIRPGITGWAQVRYQYGASLEESKEKLRYDLYYIKNISLSLDLLVILRSAKIVLLARGAR